MTEKNGFDKLNHQNFTKTRFCVIENRSNVQSVEIIRLIQTVCSNRKPYKNTRRRFLNLCIQA